MNQMQNFFQYVQNGQARSHQWNPDKSNNINEYKLNNTIEDTVRQMNTTRANNERMGNEPVSLNETGSLWVSRPASSKGSQGSAARGDYDPTTNAVGGEAGVRNPIAGLNDPGLYNSPPTQALAQNRPLSASKRTYSGEHLTQLLGAWGTNNSTWDLDGDGIVGQGDLDILLSNWGG